MGDLSEHFSRDEMACHCGCGFNTIDAETLKLAEIAREFVGHPITPSSAARCVIHNHNAVGGVNSQHLFGRAMDLPTSDPEALYYFLCEKFPDKYGFGLYVEKGFVHIDTRSGKMGRWHGN